MQELQCAGRPKWLVGQMVGAMQGMHYCFSSLTKFFVTIALMTTGAFGQNIGKLFSELKLVPDNLLFAYIFVSVGSVAASYEYKMT